jgi:hypothetical protein
MKYLVLAAVAAAVALAAGTSFAGEADVVGVRMTQRGETYNFAVTVRHADAGWDHYADKWDVLTPGGEVISTRVLAHPHDNEQPFTRSLGGVRIPAGMAKVRVRAHDKVHGYGGAEMDVDMKTGQAGPGGGSS